MSGKTVTITGIPGDKDVLSFVIPVPAGTYSFKAELLDGTTLVPGTNKTASNKTITFNTITRFPEVDLTPVITASPLAFSDVPYTGTTGNSINYSIANVAAGEIVTATANKTWIKNIQVADGTVTFDVAENYYNSDENGAARSGVITLSYTGAADVVEVQINQNPAPVITASPLSFEISGQQAHSGSTINYSISNVAPGAMVTATSDQTSIHITNTTSEAITFSTDKKFSSGTITLSYTGANSVVITVTNTHAH